MIVLLTHILFITNACMYYFTYYFTICFRVYILFIKALNQELVSLQFNKQNGKVFEASHIRC